MTFANVTTVKLSFSFFAVSRNVIQEGFGFLNML